MYKHSCLSSNIIMCILKSCANNVKCFMISGHWITLDQWMIVFNDNIQAIWVSKNNPILYQPLEKALGKWFCCLVVESSVWKNKSLESGFLKSIESRVKKIVFGKNWKHNFENDWKQSKRWGCWKKRTTRLA